MKKENIKEKIFAKLDRDGYILDQELFKLYGGEPPFYYTSIIISEWNRRKRDREFFADKKIIKLSHYKNRYQASTDGQFWYRVSKEYWYEILPKFKKDNSRPDLTSLEKYELA